VKGKAALALVAALALAAATASPLGAYPGGTPDFVTDAGTFCASCHSSADRTYHREGPDAKAAKEVIENKHYSVIRAGRGNYGELDEKQRTRLIAALEKLDKATRVMLEVPKSANPGEHVRVYVETTGGAGPVVGVMLLDTDIRYQARTPAATGWTIVGAPRVYGPDGEEQTGWIDKRAPELGRNINYVNVEGVEGDVAKGVFPKTKTEWTLLAPTEPGTYTLTAAMLYGSEKATELGAKKTIRGESPRGGFGGASGRVLFSKVATIEVK